MLKGRAVFGNAKAMLSMIFPVGSALFLRPGAELLKQIKAERPRILIIDAPQLFESDLDALCDVITAVTADEKLRLSRICSRDGVSEAQARLRLSAQHDEAFFRKNADHVLENNGNTEELLIKAGALYDMICI